MSDDSDSELLRTGAGLRVLGEISASTEERFVGRDLAGYRIAGLIAEGGMSRVYRAARMDGSFEREVAIKISTVSSFDRRMRERFLQEQGVLAGLNHPNISQLYDAQVTEEGWPYIVMELVDGEAIDRHCSVNALDLESRLRLLIDVVDAVSFAHTRLIVHRDIKPSNVLVDAGGRAKLLDFGIAKLLETESAELTRAAPMTPRYASPEQLLGAPITTASDIYQLGLLIGEILTGASIQPTEPLQQAIRRAADRRPVLIDSAARRRLPREIALVIEHCLRINPDERYRDASSLKWDLQAYLDGFPVSAAGQKVGYRFRKFIARNIPATVVVVMATVAVAASTAWYTAAVSDQRDEAQQQSELANESLDFLVSFFTAADPATSQGVELTAREMLDLGAARIEEELADRPRIKERLLYEVANTYWRLKEPDKAEPIAQAAVRTNESLYGAGNVRRLDSLNLLANIYIDQGRFADAEKILLDVLEQSTRELGMEHADTLRVQNNLGALYWETGRLPEALDTFESLFEVKSRVIGKRERTTIATAINLVALYNALSKFDSAREVGDEYLAIAEEELGELHPLTLGLLNNIANIVYFQDGLDAAIPLYEDVRRRTETVYGADNFTALRRKAYLGSLIAENGDVARGAQLQREAISAMTEQRGEHDGYVLGARANYANTLVLSGKLEEAANMLPEIIASQEEVIGARHSNTYYTRVVYADVLLQTQDPEASAYAAALRQEIADELGGNHHWLKRLDDVLHNSMEPGAR
jgi:serine/threonine-protein kinase